MRKAWEAAISNPTWAIVTGSPVIYGKPVRGINLSDGLESP